VAGLRAGAFPVRWMPDAAYGLGYPFFNFYASLPYYIAAAFRLAGWGPIAALQATQVIGFGLAAWAMSLLGRRALSHPAATALAAIAYTCAPFHLVNVYVRGDSLSEFYAFVFYPLIFWALLRLKDKPDTVNLAWLGLSYGGLVLTHNLSAVMFSPFVGLYALYLLWTRRRTRSPKPRRRWQRVKNPAASGRASSGERLASLEKALSESADLQTSGSHSLPSQAVGFPGLFHMDGRTALLMGGGIALGLALSATLWLSAVLDLQHVWMGSKDIQTAGFFHYARHLRGRNLIQLSLPFVYELNTRFTPFSMGLVQATLILIGIGILLWVQLKKERRAMSWFWLIGLALSTWLITPLSRPAWEHLPILPIVQFPWRFLSVQAFFGALIVSTAIDALPHRWWIAAAVTVVLVSASVGALRPEYLAIDDGDVTPDHLALFESFTTNIGTTIRGEYLPTAVEPRPYASAHTLQRQGPALPTAVEGKLDEARLVARDARSQVWQVDIASDDAHLLFYTLYFAGWEGRLDGAPLAIEAMPGSGLIAARLPHGPHTVKLYLARTPMRWVADILSLCAGCTALILLVRRIRWPASARRRYAWIAALLLVPGLLFAGRLLSRTSRYARHDDLSMDFDRMPYLHHNPEGIDFGGQVRLQRYEYANHVRGGQELVVTLHWASHAPELTGRISLVTPADPHPAFHPPPLPLATDQHPIKGQATVHRLAVPGDAAPGPYYLSLTVWSTEGIIRPQNARGQTLGTTYLRPIWIENPRPARQEDASLGSFGERILLRDQVQVSADDTAWQIHLTWQATQPIPANYACSLHILGADGTDLAQRDFEGGPGYGFWPTSAWPSGQWITDRLRVPIPEGVKADDAAALSVVLYDRAQPEFPAAGSAVLPLAEREHNYQVPDAEHRVEASFGDQIELLGYDLERRESRLYITLYWQALRAMSTNWTVFAHLYDPQTEEIVAQWDARPLSGAYPTSWWREGEVISDPIWLDLATVAPGRYHLGVGLYHPPTAQRLPVSVSNQNADSNGRLMLHEIQIQEAP
jgi:hypothetical protein